MVVVSAPGSERDCRKAVRDEGFSCYMPTSEEVVVYRGRKVRTERLLFGRYLFARWTEGCDWRALTSLRLVKGLFMRVDAEEPALVRDREIDRIRALENSDGHVTGIPTNQFVRGQSVRPSTGLWLGFVGTYVGTGRAGVDVALLNLFERETKIEFSPGVLQAA